ncbi:MAG TPA: Na+/H+ antiporter, partial [Pseudonocardiaceae bacterium]|nr:Na+/H+ antiporter [Pseudonocardiaceae bacterium]
AGVDRIEADERDHAEPAGSGAYRALHRDVLTVQRVELDQLFESGAISDATRRRVRRGLDLEDAGLGDDP